ncbi:hypothetical protein [Dysgonomonas sp. ZJ709]|uniref:hypothetical protein n=1 Tax=Dysgonomonas sp. ZJ709 TaxID=2709797 RepID=UPI0013EB6BD1|nr:hypothetical protein [Dysgonomonas sp. ZJ709]
MPKELYNLTKIVRGTTPTKIDPKSVGTIYKDRCTVDGKRFLGLESISITDNPFDNIYHSFDIDGVHPATILDDLNKQECVVYEYTTTTQVIIKRGKDNPLTTMTNFV